MYNDLKMKYALDPVQISHLIIAQNALALMTLMLVLWVSFTWQKVRVRDRIAFYAFHSFLASYVSNMRNSSLEIRIAGC